MRDIDALPRFSLGTLPTPLHEAPRLGAALGLSNFLVKRDDLTGLALGGNKTRKLEYVMADIRAKGADIVITCTGPQSNRARMTAAACRKTGVDCILLLAGEYGVNKPIGNLMLDEVFGAELRFIDAPDPSSSEALEEATRIAEGLRRAGRRPYVTEVGGVPEPLADVGYYTGGRELIEQCRVRGFEPGAVLLATGSGGTHAGMLVALRAAGCHARVIGIPTDPGAAVRAARVRKHVAHLVEWLELGITIPDSEVIVQDGFSAAGHGPPDDAGVAAVRLAARTEGLLIDPIYVGKIVAALPTLVRRGLVHADAPTIMVNTGGVVSVFMYSESFARTVTAPAFAA
jgi:1-aminocyclopropane-1-carboxylate deaminase/D-cysteine desulfhydrase-like pyridoxal-dependent ACC family enzyme